MRIPGRARVYERTCADCGYAWPVPRGLARKDLRSISAFNVGYGRIGRIDRAELKREVRADMASNQQARAFAQCPKCGSENHSDRRARRSEGRSATS
jgi:predicted nucleic-acid-binding Zn-ribbon protein